jgi:RNA polymerase sigma factor (sigma-70 family)
MTDWGRTRGSLLIRLRDAQNHAAWREFVELYQPVIYRLCRRRGVRHSDAEDLVQQVLILVARAVDRFDASSERGTFRGWLYRISHNVIVNFLSRDLPKNRATGGDDNPALLGAAEKENSSLVRMEVRRQLFREAAQRAREEFEESTFRAFWLTSVEDISIEDAATQLNKTTGAIYAARSRVLKRLRDIVQDLEREIETEK